MTPTPQEKLQQENTILREVISKIIHELGNGSKVSVDASLEFMRCAPAEVRHVTQELRSSVLKKQEALVEVSRKAGEILAREAALRTQMEANAAELKAWREGGLTEEMLRRDGGYIKVGKGCEIAIAGTTQRLAEMNAEPFGNKLPTAEPALHNLRRYAEAVDRWLQSARLYPRINHEPLLPDFRAFDVGEAEASRIIFEARREFARMGEEPYAR